MGKVKETSFHFYIDVIFSFRYAILLGAYLSKNKILHFAPISVIVFLQTFIIYGSEFLQTKIALCIK